MISNTVLIVPVHNRGQTTRSFLLCIEPLITKGVSVVVFDDGSTDNTQLILASFSDNLDILRGDGTHYWGGSINKCLDYVNHKYPKTESLILCNDDVFIPDSTIARIYKILDDGDNISSIICAYSIDSESKRVTHSGSRRTHFGALNEKPGLGLSICDLQSSVKEKEPINFVPGRLTIIKNFQKVRNLRIPEKVCHYGADTIYFAKIAQKGFCCYLDRNMMVYLETKMTGLNSDSVKLTLTERFRSLNSIKSSNNLWTRVLVGWYVGEDWLDRISLITSGVLKALITALLVFR